LELNNDTIPQTAEEAEALMNSWDAPESDTQPAQEGTEIAPPDGNKPVAPPAANAAEAKHALNYKGKEEQYPLSKIIEFAQQGRDYAQKMHELNQRSIQFEQQSKAFQAEQAKTAQRLQQYAEIEAYQQKDPSWWDHVVKSYQEAKGSNAQAPSQVQLPPEVANKLETLEQFVQQHTQKAEDTELDSTITGYKDEFKQFDWNTPDDKGRDLERQILDHAIELGFTKPSQFRIAANDYLFKQHAERSKMNGKVEVAKQIQKTTKLGLGPVTSQPSAKSGSALKNPAALSYDEIAALAIKENGLS